MRNTASFTCLTAYNAKHGFFYITLIVWQYKRPQVLTGEPLTGTSSLTEGLPKDYNVIRPDFEMI